MARRTTTVTIDADGRDRGKVYKITEMSASGIEDFAARAFVALAKSGAQVPAALMTNGLAGLATLGPNALSAISYGDLKPLLDDMMSCVTVCPDKRRPDYSRTLQEEDIEEFTTRLHLRREVWTLHVGFLAPASPSTSGSTPVTTGDSPTT